jgi:Rrf2 family transcriptional regulator, nitric oxide-sensitive transcriptional repressor
MYFSYIFAPTGGNDESSRRGAMRLTMFTDYCLRVLMYVALQPAGARVTVPQIAGDFGISRAHLTKVVHHLGATGVLRNVRGHGGGFELARPAAAINIGTVVRDAESEVALVECFDRRTNRCVITRACRLRGAFNTAIDAFYDALDRYTLADITGNREPLIQLIFSRRPRRQPPTARRVVEGAP